MARLISVITGILWNSVVSKFRPSTLTVKIGEYTYGNPAVISFRRDDSVIIGKFCSIAEDTIIVASGEHSPSRVSTYPLKSRFVETKEVDSSTRGPVIIGNDVWVGAGVIILSGVRVGDGVIIGAGSVVTQDVPPYAIVAGVPAKLLRFRFTQDQIKKLLEISWWNWDLKEILRNIDYFYGDIESFLEKFSNQDHVQEVERRH